MDRASKLRWPTKPQVISGEPQVISGENKTSATLCNQTVSQVPSTQGQSHAAAPIDSQNVTGLKVNPARHHITQQHQQHSQDSSVVEQKGDLVPGDLVPINTQNSSLVNPASLQPSVTQQAPSYPNSNVEGPSGVPQSNIPQQTNILNLDTWLELTEKLRAVAMANDEKNNTIVYDLATDNNVFMKCLIYPLGAYCYHQNEQTKEEVSSPSNSSDSTALTSGNTELTHSNGHSVLSKQEKLEKGLSNIEALFNAVKNRRIHLEDPMNQEESATNTTQTKSDGISSLFGTVYSWFFPQSEPPTELTPKTVSDVSQEFKKFYTSNKMDFEVLRYAVDTQFNTTLFEKLYNAINDEYVGENKKQGASTNTLNNLNQQKEQASQMLGYYKKLKNASFALIDEKYKNLNVQDNVSLSPLDQKNQVLLLSMGMTALKAKNTQSKTDDIRSIINKNPAEKRSTLCEQWNTNVKFTNDDYVVLNDENEISNKDQYKKPSHLITRFFYSLSRRLSPTDYSGEYREAMEKVRKSVSDDFGSQASQRFNIEFGSRYRSGRPLTFGALRKFLTKEKALANGKEYVLQASPGENILQQEFEKAYPNTRQEGFLSEDKKVLLAQFLKDHQDFIVVKKDENSSGDTSSLGKKDWWLWPSQPDIKKANRETLELSEPKFKELFEKNTAGTLLVQPARTAEFQEKITPFLQQEKYLTIADITQVQSFVENLSEKKYDGLQGTFEALVSILSGPSEAMTTATNIAHAAAGARAFGNGNTVLHGVGNAASIGTLLAALPEEYGIRLAAATIFALRG